MNRVLLIAAISIAFVGCNKIGQHSLKHRWNKESDEVFVREFVPTCNQPILEAARCVTEFEDSLRRDGTITVKTPDVWGDSELMHSIQEFDTEMHKTIGNYGESFQASIATSDAAGISSDFSGSFGAVVNDGDDGKDESQGENESTLSVLAAKESFAMLGKLAGKDASPTSTLKLEPTERERQHATYVYLNQALRRRAMGGDNTRKAGYGLYLFRIPVSVLPGEETSQGYSAVVNLRARAITTPADVKYTLPRMAIADLVDALAESIIATWSESTRDESVKKKLNKLSSDVGRIAKLEEIAVDPNLPIQIDLLLVDHSKLKDGDLDLRIKAVNELVRQFNASRDLKKAESVVESVLTANPNSLELFRDFIDQANHVRLNNFDEAKMIAAMNIYDQKLIQSHAIKKMAHASRANGSVPTLLDDLRDVEKLAFRSFARQARISLTDTLVAGQKPEFNEVMAADHLADNFVSLADSMLSGNAKTIQEPSSPNLDKIELMKAAGVGTPSPTTPASSTSQSKSSGVAQLSRTDFKTQDAIAVREWLKKKQPVELRSIPSQHELRGMLFESFTQLEIQLEKHRALEFTYVDGQYSIQEAARRIEKGMEYDELAADWQNQLHGLSSNDDKNYWTTAWLLARQCGLVDLNIKRMMREMHLSGSLSDDELAPAEYINFFAEQDVLQANLIWQRIVQEEFPLQVFTLEPMVEEQNLIDAQSRLRQMQTALAYSVAQGGWNAKQRVEMARELARESVAVGINRTTVGFAHGTDTFGWYFHPRIQSPDVETNNCSVFTRLCKTGGPTRKDDLRTYRLEPGVRECDVLIAMPSFISRVDFDITTNWESLANPGRSKRSYEELVQEGCKLIQMTKCLDAANCGPECRPGDLERLKSRAAQLENMLGMQTHQVKVPFQYDQSAIQLFEKGDRELVPIINGHYGLNALAMEVVENKSSDGKVTVSRDYVKAEFFVTGHNFHPTQTHVVVGGHESHSIGETPSVEVLSRELIRVSTVLKTDKFASSNGFELRVGTPGGLSNPLTIAKSMTTDASIAKEKASAFDWSATPKFTVFHVPDPGNNSNSIVTVFTDSPEDSFTIKSSSDNPLSINDFQNQNLSHEQNPKLKHRWDTFELRVVYEANFKDDSKRTIKGLARQISPSLPITSDELQRFVTDDLGQLGGKGLRPTDAEEGTITGTAYLRLDNWSLIKLDKTIDIKLKPRLKTK